MRILLDTNRLTDLFRSDPALIRLVESAAEVWLSFVTVAEIKCGFVAGTRSAANETLLLAFLQLPRVGVIYADHETTEIYARLFFQRRRAGNPISTNDLWITSLAVQHQLVLVSGDKHFGKLRRFSERSSPNTKCANSQGHSVFTAPMLDRCLTRFLKPRLITRQK